MSISTHTLADWLPAVTDLLLPLQGSGAFLEWAIVFFVLAIIAALVGASGVAGVTMTVAKWFVIIFIVLALITLVL